METRKETHMNILTGINNVLMFINDNWTTITIILGLGILI